MRREFCSPGIDDHTDGDTDTDTDERPLPDFKHSDRQDRFNLSLTGTVTTSNWLTT